MNSSSSNNEWNAYWNSERVAACRSDDEGLYQGAIGQYWRRVFKGLNADQKVLDLATGNAALAAIAFSQVQAGEVPAFSFYGVDSAEIHPPICRFQHPFAQQARFYSDTSNESLPFAANMFDLVTAQYGVEYGDLQASLNESIRVLKEQGEIHWVCHWHDGFIATKTRQEVRDIAYLQTLQLQRHLLNLLRLQWDGQQFIPGSHQRTAQSPERHAMTESFNRAFLCLRQNGHSETGNLNLYLHNLAHLYQHREQHGFHVVAEKVNECGMELEYHRLRLQALSDAALKPEMAIELLQQAKGNGLRCLSHGEMLEQGNGHVVAYEFTFQK